MCPGNARVTSFGTFENGRSICDCIRLSWIWKLGLFRWNGWRQYLSSQSLWSGWNVSVSIYRYLIAGDWHARRKAGIQPYDTYAGHAGSVTGLHFHPMNGPINFSELFLTSSIDWTVKLWKIKVSFPAHYSTISDTRIMLFWKRWG